MHPAVLKTECITKSFGHVAALRGVSLSVRRGGITAVVGDNGSGKSTFIKIISGMLAPDGGSIAIDGTKVSSLTAREAIRLGVRTVYQDLALDNCKNSIENIFLGAEIMKGPFLNRRAMAEQAAALLNRLHVEIPDLNEPVCNLSGGQRQGLAIARALLNPGRVLLLDEPTAAMGIEESHRALDLFRKFRDEGMTQLLISHNLHQVYSLADDIYVFRAGRCVAETRTADMPLEALQSLLLRREEGGDA